MVVLILAELLRYITFSRGNPGPSVATAGISLDRAGPSGGVLFQLGSIGKHLEDVSNGMTASFATRPIKTSLTSATTIPNSGLEYRG